MNQYQIQLRPHKSMIRGMAPLRPLTPLQRIGYLDEVSEIRCCNSFAEFKAGQWYKVLTSLVQVIRWDSRKNLDGQIEQIELTGQELAVLVTDESGQPRCFMDRRFVSDKIVISEGIKPEFGFNLLADNFHLPDVPSVPELYPARYKRMKTRLEALQGVIRMVRPENESFRFTGYQLEDLAASAVRDGFVLGHGTGLGKSLSMIAWALIKTDILVIDHKVVVQYPILIVTLGDLKAQVAQEARDKFGIECKSLITLGDLEDVTRGLYIASYEYMANPEVAMCATHAFSVVLVDEATKMKESATKISQAVRSLNPLHRCVATATPVKNRLQDLFWLLHWAAGGKPKAHRAFPFDGTPAGLKKFEALYLLRERNLTREATKRRAGRMSVVKRPSAEVCNLHSIWRITSALIVRRRKQDVPECTTKKIEHTIYVPLGTEQARAYEAARGAGQMALRQAATCPSSENLEVRGAEMTPKLMAVLKTILLCVSKEQQVIVFSAFNAMSDIIHRRLKQVKIESVLLDGRVSPVRRGNMAAMFKQGHPWVMLAGEGSMSYGHSFSKCQNAILTSEDWAMDLMSQAPDRAHRLDSLSDLNVYRFLANGTIEERVHSLHQDKQGGAEMVLDAQVPDELTPSDLSEVLDQPLEPAETVDESTLESEWTCLISK